MNDSVASVAAQDVEVLRILRESFPGKVVETRVELGDWVAAVQPGALLEVMRFLKDDKRTDFKVLMDLTAVDGLGLGLTPRFSTVYHLLSLSHKHRLRVKVSVPDEKLEAPSLVPIWPIADWFEREVWDMFGIRFSGHPNLKRILMYEEFVGHPLRKDYPVDRRQPLIGPKN